MTSKPRFLFFFLHRDHQLDSLLQQQVSKQLSCTYCECFVGHSSQCQIQSNLACDDFCSFLTQWAGPNNSQERCQHPESHLAQVLCFFAKYSRSLPSAWHCLFLQLCDLLNEYDVLCGDAHVCDDVSHLYCFDEPNCIVKPLPRLILISYQGRLHSDALCFYLFWLQ